MESVLKCIVACFTGTNLHNILYIVDEDLAIADLAGIQHLLHCVHDFLRRDLCHNGFDLDLLAF